MSAPNTALSIGAERTTAQSGSRRAGRIVLVGCIALYVVVFCSTYVFLTAPRYDYFGLGFNGLWRLESIGFFVLLALLPAFWLPCKVERPSDLFILVQYLIIYIPTLFIAQHSTLPVLSTSSWLTLSFAMFLGMCVLIWARRTWRILRLPRVKTREEVLWGAVAVATIASISFLFWLLGENFRLVRLEEIYSVREGVTEIIEGSGSRFGGYPFFWTNNVFLPLLFAAAMRGRNFVLMVAVLGAYVFLFGVWGAKMSLLAPAYLLMFHILLGRSREWIAPMLALGLSGLLLVPVILSANGIWAVVDESWISIVHARTFGVPSLLISQYLDYFNSHPLTFGSHITGLNLIIEYPYDYDIARTVGYHYYGTVVTSNVNFWAQDGIAGFGVTGILLASLAAAVALWLFDAASAGLPLQFVGTSLGAVFLSFLSTSLFTTLVTGGLLMIGVFYWLLSRDKLS